MSFPNKELAHHVSVDWSGDWRTDNYRNTSIDRRRPAKGRIIAPISCCECGKPVSIRIYSLSALKRQRYLWSAIALVLTCAEVPLGWAAALMVSAQDNHPTKAHAALSLTTGIGFVVVAFTIAGYLTAAITTDGVSIVDERSGPHSIRKWGSTSHTRNTHTPSK